jgi:hypothetical protein
MVGIIFNAGPLFSIAKNAYETTKGTGSDRSSDHDEALVAIVFAAASLEAFINEAAELASIIDVPGEVTPTSVKTFASTAEEVGTGRGSIRLKFLLAKAAFQGETYDKGTQPYQDFNSLVDLRNALVHLKPRDKIIIQDGTLSVEVPSVINGLRSRKILAEFGPKSFVTWTALISTRAVARWACNTAAAMVHSVLDILPESHFKVQMESLYREPFGHLE